MIDGKTYGFLFSVTRGASKIKNLLDTHARLLAQFGIFAILVSPTCFLLCALFAVIYIALKAFLIELTIFGIQAITANTCNNAFSKNHWERLHTERPFTLHACMF